MVVGELLHEGYAWSSHLILNKAWKQLTSLMAPARLEDWNREARTFDGLAGSYFENVTDTTGAMPEAGGGDADLAAVLRGPVRSLRRAAGGRGE